MSNPTRKYKSRSAGRNTKEVLKEARVVPMVTVCAFYFARVVFAMFAASSSSKNGRGGQMQIYT